MAGLPRMVPALQAILMSELALGNSIAEVAEWPPRCRLLVILSRPFRVRHPLAAGLSYEELNDPHYWKAGYHDRDGSECLACRFGE